MEYFQSILYAIIFFLILTLSRGTPCREGVVIRQKNAPEKIDLKIAPMM
jgi:hypothetical protein